MFIQLCFEERRNTIQYEIHIVVRGTPVGLEGTLYCQTNGVQGPSPKIFFVYEKYRCEIVSFEAVLGITNKFKSNTLLLKM